MQPVVIAPTDRLSRYYSQRVREIMQRFDGIRELINHEGMKGSRVEIEVRKFLMDFLPDRYGYSSGIVVDSSGGECDRSRQQDLLIIDRLFNPKLFVDEEPSVYPVEVVYSSVEVKTSIDGSELRKAVANVASIKKLAYMKERISYWKGNTMTLTDTSPPIGGIFAFDTPLQTGEALLDNFSRALSPFKPQEWPDFLCILNRGMLGTNANNKPVLNIFGLLGSDGDRVTTLVTHDQTHDVMVDKRSYPVLSMNGQRYIIDVARTFLAFLRFFHASLLAKHIPSTSNLLDHYVPNEMKQFVGFSRE